MKPKSSEGKGIKLICNKCGKEPKIDKENSNKNWTVYKNGDCLCGGSYEFKVNYGKTK
jgi:hypothetical protein